MEFEVHLGNLDIIKAIVYSHVRNKAIWAMCIVSSVLIHGISVVGLWAMEWPLQETISIASDFFYMDFRSIFCQFGSNNFGACSQSKMEKG